MDKMSKSEFQATISKQNEQLKRYESRLRDVVTAYKGILREKEALESSLAAIKDSSASAGDEGQDTSLATLTQSMATLAAEKARMEEAYQNDRKVAKEQTDRKIKELQDQLQSLSKLRQTEIENVKAKLTFEIQEREREQTEHGLMLKELQTMLTTERRLKEEIEDKLLLSNDLGAKDLEKRFRDLNNELEATQRKLNRAEARTIETPQMLVQLQEEIAQMKQNHLAALREEKIKAKKAEEMGKRICASQEERIAALEAKLAELSNTIGEYDVQRRKDQDVIQSLKENINFKQKEDAVVERPRKETKKRQSIEEPKSTSQFAHGMLHLKEIVEKIHLLKTELITVNGELGDPIDMRTIFNMAGGDSDVQNVHVACQAEIAALKVECNVYKSQIAQNGNVKTKERKEGDANDQDDPDQLKYHIKMLQDKIGILNQQLEDGEKEAERKITRINEKFNNERATHKEEMAEQKNKVQSLEQQLQTQRDRYATLLSERESEIRRRQEKRTSESSDKAPKYDYQETFQDVSAPPHMLHYAHEQARKDLEISGLRREKHLLEGHLRDAQREIAIEKDRFKEVRRSLKDEIERLRRIQSREGANLEYLKNVVMSYLLTSDPLSKKHMLNAIAAVLHFTDAERECVDKIS